MEAVTTRLTTFLTDILDYESVRMAMRSVMKLVGSAARNEAEFSYGLERNPGFDISIDSIP